MQEVYNVIILTIQPDHILELDKLPFYHKDPFNRLLIAQVNIEQSTLISCDGVFNQYSVDIDW